MVTPIGIATISHAYSNARVASSPRGTLPSLSSANPTIIAMIAPTGRSLLADVTNSSTADNPAMDATRDIGLSSTSSATNRTKPMTMLTSTSIATLVTMLATRSGRIRKKTT